MESWNENSEESVSIAADKEADSEEVVENCTPCNLDEATVQAEHYCADCDEYYCGTCVKLHKKYCKNCPGINVLGISDMRQWGQKKKETHRFQHMCENHPEKKLEMFCETHDIVCCHVCVSLHHRSCSQIAYIPHIAMKLGQSDATEKLLKDVKHITKDAVKSKSAREKDKVTLDKSKSNYEKTVLELNAKYLAILKSLKEKTTETMTDLYDKYRKEIEDDIEDINKMTKDMNDIQECLTNKDDVISNFIYIKESQRKVNKSYKTLSDKLNNRNVQYKFTVDEKVQTFLNAVSDLQPNPEKHLSGLEHLGKPVPDTQQVTTNSPDKVFEACTGGSFISAKQRYDSYLLRRKDSLVQIFKELSYLNDNPFLLTMHLQSVESEKITENYLGSIDISGAVTFNSACFITDDDIARTFSNKTIIISPLVVSSTKLIKEMQFDHDCFGIAHHDGILYVSSREGSVYMYDLSQTCIKKIETDQYGHKCFYTPHHMTISPDKTKLYVTDWLKGLVTLDMSGKVLSTFSHPDLAGACDVTTDIEGHVFVYGYNSKNVVQINSNGTEKIQTLISGLDRSPISLSCVSIKSFKYLMVSCCYQVDAYKLTEAEDTQGSDIDKT